MKYLNKFLLWIIYKHFLNKNLYSKNRSCNISNGLNNSKTEKLNKEILIIKLEKGFCLKIFWKGTWYENKIY